MAVDSVRPLRLGELVNCEYCGALFNNRYTAERDKSTHKASCEKKRYLGGELTMEHFNPAELEID